MRNESRRPFDPFTGLEAQGDTRDEGRRESGWRRQTAAGCGSPASTRPARGARIRS